MERLLKNLCVRIIFLVVVIYSSTALAEVQTNVAGPEKARDFIQDVSERTITILSKGKISDDVIKKNLEDLFDEVMDTKWIARFVLGRYWRDVSDEQKEIYIPLYHKYLQNSYIPKFKQYTNQKIVLKKYSTEDDNEFLVQTEIVADNEEPVRVDYKVKYFNDGQFRIYDIIAEGVSLITTHRSEFGSILSRQGIEALIAKLEERVNKEG